MAILPIYVAPHPVLKKIAEPVGEVTDAHRQLMDDMLHTMYAAPGIGLAAPQVGQSLRILIIDIDQPKVSDEEGDADPMRRKGKPQYFVNPEITWASEEENTYDEGCLSLPGQFAEVVRPKQVKVKFLDYHGKPQEIECDGLLATCIQHEMDHLNGVLFVDHLSTLKRDIVMRKLKKWTKEFQDEEGFAETYAL